MIGIAVGLGLIAIVIEVTILCCKSVGRKAPMNYILLFTFTACVAFLFCVICSFFPAAICLTSAGLTTIFTAGLTLKAYFVKPQINEKTDFTIIDVFWVLCATVHPGVYTVIMFMTFGAWWHPIVVGAVIYLYAIILFYDIRLITDGKHDLEWNDYILGALIMYIDIMFIFLELIKCFGRRKE